MKIIHVHTCAISYKINAHTNIELHFLGLNVLSEEKREIQKVQCCEKVFAPLADHQTNLNIRQIKPQKIQKQFLNI